MNRDVLAQPVVPPGSHSLKIRDNTFDFLGTRTVYWREAQTLLVADLHWGKTEVFQRHGVPVPRGVLKDDLARLSQSIESCKAKRLIVLGDLIHSTSGITTDVTDEVAAWRAKHDLHFHLVLGNHDRHLNAPASWKIDEETKAYEEDQFVFAHDEVKNTKQYVFSGHLHPMARLSRRGDSLRLPCFLIKNNCTLLPAFSFFTGGFDVTPREDEVLLVIADGQVIKM